MQMFRVSSRLMTAAAVVAAVACNTTNEGTASVKGAVNGKSLQAQSALFVSTAVQATGNGNTTNPVGNGNTTNPGDTNTLNPVGNTNATLPVRAGVAGQSLMITISNQGDVCAQAGDNKQPANADYLVLSLVGQKAIAAGTFNIVAGETTVNTNTLLPGNLTPATVKTNGGVVRADPVPNPTGDANTGMPTGDANTVKPTGDGNSVNPVDGNTTMPADTSVVATATYLSVDAKCGGTPVAAKSGSVTLTQVDATGTVEGMFNVTTTAGDVVTGSFKAQSCAALLSSNASPYSCN